MDEEEGYDRPVVDPEGPEAIIESEIGSSDLDIMEEDDRPRRRMKKGGKSEHRDQDVEMESDLEDFIVRPEQRKAERPHKPTKKVKPHDIFNTDLIDKQLEVTKEHRINKIYTREEIEEQYATEKDLKIKLCDVPERILKNFTDE
jgi:hypothetical protein